MNYSLNKESESILKTTFILKKVSNTSQNLNKNKNLEVSMKLKIIRMKKRKHHFSFIKNKISNIDLHKQKTLLNNSKFSIA